MSLKFKRFDSELIKIMAFMSSIFSRKGSLKGVKLVAFLLKALLRVWSLTENTVLRFSIYR